MCHVTQPTLSNAVAQFEDELGQRLFVRTTRKVTLTPFGTYLLPSIESVLESQKALLDRARSYLKPDIKLIRIGTSPLLNPALLNVLIEPFRMKHPDVDIVLREMNMADLNSKDFMNIPVKR